jgi:hypothetical protein
MDKEDVPLQLQTMANFITTINIASTPRLAESLKESTTRTESKTKLTFIQSTNFNFE